MATNTEIYQAVRSVPQEAQKRIEGGRLKGMTDINPMWRIKTLTEQFGACGVGWYYEVTDKRLETSLVSDEVSANVMINLFVKIDGEWSKPIVGIGGSMFVSKEKERFYTDDECYKKALTDAISVACKALGFGADIYWDKDVTKYSEKKGEGVEKPKFSREDLEVKIVALCDAKRIDIADICKKVKVGSLEELTDDRLEKCLEYVQGL